ncbi:MAG: hypothetical protein JW894_05970 [Bacteroidales bacterium]|nr:hypothetical protein [Bacteroidales bacterium]
MKELTVIISSTWKFAATFPVAVFLFKMSFFEILLYTNIGGILGIVVSTMISKGIIRVFNALLPARKKKNRKVFTKRNRRLVLLKTKYGLPGIVILTPILLSIPLGVFLNTKYYGYNKLSYLYLLLSQIAWSIVFTAFYIKVKVLI